MTIIYGECLEIMKDANELGISAIEIEKKEKY